jgi:hypothetical protein
METFHSRRSSELYSPNTFQTSSNGRITRNPAPKCDQTGKNLNQGRRLNEMVSQMVAAYQQKKVQEITEKLKGVIITRLGELGEKIFTRASIFFLEVKLEARNFKLIQRYSGLAGRTRLVLQRLNNWSEQYGELPANSQGRITLLELDKLFWRIDERLQELPAEKFEGSKEVELIIELDEFREKLAVSERFILKLDENPDLGLTSSQ